MNRRALLTNSAIISVGVLAAGLAGCANQTTSQLTNDVNLLDTGLAGLDAALATLPPNEQPSPAIMAQIQAALTDLNTNTGQIANALTPNASTVTAIQTDVTTIAALAQPFFPASAVIANVINAAVAVAANLVTMLTPAPAPAAGMGAASMGVPQARLVLAAAPAMLKKP